MITTGGDYSPNHGEPHGTAGNCVPCRPCSNGARTGTTRRQTAALFRGAPLSGRPRGARFRRDVALEEYDAAAGTFDCGGLTLTFPVRPAHFLQIVAEVNGLRGPQTVDAIRQDDGRWWIVLPTF